MERYAIGVDLGGTSAKCALVSENGRILETGSVETPANDKSDKILATIETEINRLRQKAIQINCDPQVIGMGTPGSIDIEKGYLIGSTPNFKHWKNVPIAEKLKERTGLPVFVDNDANVMSLGEFVYGAGKNYQNIICLTVGTGIGGAIIINGNLYRGSAYAGGELGHVSIKSEGRNCRCGGRGCLEQYASATAMLREFKELSGSNGVSNVKKLFELKADNNSSASQAIHDAAYAMGRGVANFINIFNPEAVVIGGGVAEAGEIYLAIVRDTAMKFAMPAATQSVKIISATLGNDAGFMGAAHFAFEMHDSHQ